jgi:fructose transport system ATP-binding protein
MNESTPAAIPTAEPMLESQGLVKTYGRVVALDHLDFALYPGEVLAVIGDNGAGKSTLVKCLSGAELPDKGVIRLEGEEVRFRKPSEALVAGIETVYQRLAVAPGLDVASNLALGRELYKPTPMGKFLRKLEANGILKPRVYPRKVMIFDEPTAPLGVRDAAQVLRLIQHLRERGTPVVFVSHNIPHVLKVADRIHVQRFGKRIAVVTPRTFGHSDVVAIMSGALQVDIDDQTLGPVR